MARTKQGTPPSYPSRPHKGQARITVRLTTGARREVPLGHFGSPESWHEYRRVLALLAANGGRYPAREDGLPAAADLTLSELALAFWKHAERYYVLADESPSRELEIFRDSLDPALDLFGHRPAAEFGPLALKAVREKMVAARRHRVRFTDGDKTFDRWVGDKDVRAEGGQARWRGVWRPAAVLDSKPSLCRKVINQRVEHVKRLFAWAVGEELVPVAVHEALLRVRGLRRGQEGTRDNPRVKPVPDEDVEKTLPHLLPQVRAMVQLQRLIGARSSEICLMRGRAVVDRDRPVWWYKIDPNEVRRDEAAGRAANLHKTAHHEDGAGAAVVKLLPIGPKAQEILRPWLRDDPDAFLFQPAEARAAMYALRRAGRKTPLWDAHLRAQAAKRKAEPERAPGEHYTRYSYGQAVRRAAAKAGVPHWHPHQLKHACGTTVRERHGAEAAQAFLGHSKLSTTEIYAEKNLKEVGRVALEMG